MSGGRACSPPPPFLFIYLLLFRLFLIYSVLHSYIYIIYGLMNSNCEKKEKKLGKKGTAGTGAVWKNPKQVARSIRFTTITPSHVNRITHASNHAHHPIERKHHSDIRASADPTATLGDDNAPALQNTRSSMGQSSSVESERMDVDNPVARDVTMAVVDGIVFGPPVWLIFLH